MFFKRVYNMIKTFKNIRVKTNNIFKEKWLTIKYNWNSYQKSVFIRKNSHLQDNLFWNQDLHFKEYSNHKYKICNSKHHPKINLKMKNK